MSYNLIPPRNVREVRTRYVNLEELHAKSLAAGEMAMYYEVREFLRKYPDVKAELETWLTHRLERLVETLREKR